MSELRRRILLALAFVVAAIGLMVLQRSGYWDPLEGLIERPLVGVQRSISQSYYNIHDFLAAPRSLAQLQGQNAQLEAEVAQLEAQVVTLREQTAQLNVLSALLGFAREQPENQYIAASVVGRDTNPFLRYLILDQGSDSGVQRGMPVVSQNGLVGRISEVTGSASKVQLIIDPQSSVNAEIQGASPPAEGIVSGEPTGELELTFVPQDATMKAGDLVVTSGLGGGFPPDILIGQVVSVHKQDTELYQTAVIQPRDDFSTLEILLVISNFQPVNIQPLESEASSP
ncbi:MAG: rod shape-determining protein MreC [Anaerolineales bacterium]